MNSTLAIKDVMIIPNPLPEGKPVPVRGIISSNHNITNVTAEIKTSGGSVMYSDKATINAKTYDTKLMNNNLMFSKLPAGSYTYVVTAKDASGKPKTLCKKR